MSARNDNVSSAPWARGGPILEFSHGQTRVAVAPRAGFNVFSIQYNNVELLRQPPPLVQSLGFNYGTPILYPTPNRIRNGVFSYGGRTFTFPRNDGLQSLHALVCDAEFTVESVAADVHRTVVSAALPFVPGSRLFELFPLEHTLRISLVVEDGRVQWTYSVDNTSRTTDSVPFGFALHPWFLLHAPARAGASLKVPATHWMVADDTLVPTGELMALDCDAARHFDLRSLRPVAEVNLDHVYFGMRPSAPAEVVDSNCGIRTIINSSAEFTHFVVFTPVSFDHLFTSDEPTVNRHGFYCIEPQTCSTDCHNLSQAQGGRYAEVAHLLVAPPGASVSGTTTFSFEKLHQEETVAQVASGGSLGEQRFFCALGS